MYDYNKIFKPKETESLAQIMHLLCVKLGSIPEGTSNKFYWVKTVGCNYYCLLCNAEIDLASFNKHAIIHLKEKNLLPFI